MSDKTYTININNRTILNLIWISLVVLALIKIKSIILIILTSVVIASFIGTSATSLKNRIGMSRSFSVALMYLLTVGVFALVFYFFVPVLLKEIVNILPIISEYFPNTPYLIGMDFDNIGSMVSKAPMSDVVDNLKTILNTVSSGFVSTISAFFGGVFNVILVAVISFYLSISKDGISNFLKIITPIQSEEYVVNLWERAQRKIAYWMSGQVVLAIIVGLLTFIGLKILNVEYAVLLSVVVALFELIPFGVYLAAVPAVTLSFASGGLTLAIMVVCLYLIVQQLESYLIAPLVVQKATGISPLVVILSVLIGINLAGFWGLILAIPVAVTILEYVKDLEEAKKRKMENLKNPSHV